MENKEKVIEGLETIKQFFGYGLSSTAEMFDSYYGILNDAIALLKEQEEEIENLKQTAQSMMEGIVISVPKENPCSSCQEFNCDICAWKKYRN